MPGGIVDAGRDGVRRATLVDGDLPLRVAEVDVVQGELAADVAERDRVLGAPA